ncbi:MAG: T9SS type A sorting domain-containing protein [Bacteroidales bacterium]|nr:T9SS type A sorting domain-containing protein [Bacteroidales bacterium]
MEPIYTPISYQSIYRKEDVAVPVSVNEQRLDDNSIVIYPNPATDQLNVRFNNSIDEGSWEVLNLQGQIIARGQFSAAPNASLTIDLENMEAGYYLLKVSAGNESQTHKFVKR